jgi:hypothetical protein
MRRKTAALLCAECGAESDELALGWPGYLARESDQDELEAQVLMLCPRCAEREFGPFGWHEHPFVTSQHRNVPDVSGGEDMIRTTARRFGDPYP